MNKLRRIKVSVEQRHIDAAFPYTYEDPVQRSLKEQFPNPLLGIRVFNKVIAIGGRYYNTTVRMRIFFKQWDRHILHGYDGLCPKPANFILTLNKAQWT